MRIIVTGGRQFDDWQLFNQVMLEYTNDASLVIVHGANPRGADAMADRWCRKWDVQVERHPADWSRFKKAAGPMRNQEMVDLGADLVVAFPDPHSIGTWDCVDRAEAADIPVRFGVHERRP